MLDPANHTNAPDGFSASEIRAAFLRFFVSIFRGYLAHVVMPTSSSPYPEKLFAKEAFLKSCGHLPESSHAFMNAFLDSQVRSLGAAAAATTPFGHSGYIADDDDDGTAGTANSTVLLL